MKAIQILKKIREWKITILFEEKSLNPQIIKEIDEALEELEAYKAIHSCLKSRCKSQIEEQKKNFYDSARGKVDAYTDILQKLEELTPCK